MEDKKMQRKIKLIIALIIIFVFIIIGILIIMSLNGLNENRKQQTELVSNQIIDNTNNAYSSQVTDNPEDYKNINLIEENGYNKLKYETSRSTYFTIGALYNNYINWIGYQNKEDLKNVLSPQYISKYDITDNNIFNKLTVPKTDNNKQYYKTIITEMLAAQIDDTTYIYIVKGNCRVSGKDTKFSVEVMFEVDMSNNIYNVYPYQYMNDNGYDKLKVGDTINYTAEKIEKNNSNEFVYITKTDQEMANKYFDDYRELLEYYPDEAYIKLNAEYSKKRFGSKESFRNYLKDNTLRITLMSIDKYKVNSYQDYTDYVCSDKYNNIYIFRQQGGVMRYSVFLDNYTVMLDEDVEYYNKLDKLDKAKYNLSKFIKQVNTKDYTAIYNSLDDTFKKNNFKTQDSFKKYIQKNMYDLNTMEIVNTDDKTYEYYVFNCKITNSRNSSESKNMTIIINQGEGTNYTMSFSFE